MADRFYTPQPLGLGEFVLDGPEAHHLSTVRRFSVADRITLFNGDGYEYHAEILAVAKKSVVLIIQGQQLAQRELLYPMVIASALPKGDRLDFLIEKLTELGVSTWIPLHCERSVVLGKSTKQDKLERAVIEASKQCGRNSLMQIATPRTIGELLSEQEWPSRRVFLHPSDSAMPLAKLTALEPTIVAIGPEGGFSSGEVDQFLAAQWQEVQLGPRILRLETAAITAAAVLAQRAQ